ncbi:MAG: universal stress protein [Verrucomicrobia bacterium]|nr:universal stress protein [Verrucomicrobiota bacterium]
MKTFRSIICGFDFTPDSEAALKEALRIAAEEDGTVVACHVIPPRYIDDQQQFLNLPTDVILSKVQRAVELRTNEIDGDSAVRPSVKVLMGRPEFALTEEAREMRAELLVLGSSTSDQKHRTGVIARRCIGEASCPVLINRNQHLGRYRSIIAAVDLTDLSQQVLEAAAKLAVDEEASMKVIHAHYPPWMHPTNVLYDLKPSQDEDFQKQYQEILDEEMAHLVRVSSQFLPLTPEPDVVEHVNPVSAVLTHVHSSSADLLIFGSHGASSLKERVLGTTAERLLLGSRCSVLAVPPATPLLT